MSECETTGESQFPAEVRRRARRLALLRRNGLFRSNVASAEITRAASHADLHAAYHLVHEIYAASGFIAPQASRLRLRVFEATTQMATFVAKVEGRVAGVLSVIGDSAAFGLPSDTVFPSELEALRRRGARLCEITNQAIDPRHRRSASATELIRCATAHALAMGYDRAIATVSPGHARFYKLLHFRELGSVRSYSSTIDDLVTALSIDSGALAKASLTHGPDSGFVAHYLRRGNPFLKQVREWAVDADKRFLDAELLYRLFVDDSGFLDQCRETAQHAIRAHWGATLYDAVMHRAADARPARRPWFALQSEDPKPAPEAAS